MPSRSRRPNSRRAFLKTLPTVVATGAAAPRLAGAQTGDSITASSLEIAQQLAGIDLPAADRDQARSLVARNRDNYEILRQVQVSTDVEPAFGFRPPRPESPITVSTNGNGKARSSRSARPSAALFDGPSKRPESIESLAFASIGTLAALLSSKQISSVELTRMYLDRLKRHDPTLLCVVTLTESLAMEQAEAADREIRAGRYRGPLHGVPYGIKDLFAAKGFPTTWGAKPYANQVFDYDATVVTRMREAGAVLLAKLSTGELAVGDLWFRGRTRNPWNPERGSSGSSAGPAAATSAGLVGFAIGTETGGSIMSPASTCGVVGLRPTYGRVPRTGCMTLRWTLDKVGPLTRSVADAALVLESIAGPDGHDETVPPLPFAWNGDRSVKGMRIGFVSSEFLTDEPPVEESRRRTTRRPVYGAALETLRQAGATLVPIELPDLPAAAIYAVLNAEAGAMFDELVRNGGVNDLADKGANGRANQLRASRFIPAVEYIRAQRVRTLLMQEMNALFVEKQIDVFLATTQSDSVTITNLTGHPALVVPTGFVDGVPVGLIVTGKLWDETTVLRVAAAYESATDWHTKHPNVQPVYSA